MRRAEPFSLQTKLCPSNGCCNHHMGLPLRLLSGIWVLLPFLDSSLMSCCRAGPASSAAAEGSEDGIQKFRGPSSHGLAMTKGNSYKRADKLSHPRPPQTGDPGPSPSPLLLLPLSSFIPSVVPFLSPSFPDACNTFRKKNAGLTWFQDHPLPSLLLLTGL